MKRENILHFNTTSF